MSDLVVTAVSTAETTWNLILKLPLKLQYVCFQKEI